MRETNAYFYGGHRETGIPLLAYTRCHANHVSSSAQFEKGMLTSLGRAVGLDCRYSAATPDTWGQAMDVPDATWLSVSLRWPALVTKTPGPYRSTHVP